ncbi:lipoprotein BA_5634 family protein [Bacillus cereus]|nr:lipoprotein BA_5634 family protein [Bacillus cereus]
MSKFFYACWTVLILGIVYYYYQSQPNVLLVSGVQEQVTKVTKEYQSKLSSSTQYKEKQFCTQELKNTDEASCKNIESIRVLSKTTADQLLQEKMLQKTIRPRVTESIDSLPAITKEKGVVYGDNISNEEITIEDRRIPVTKAGDGLGVGVGQGQKTQQKLLIVDDSVYNELPLKENTFSILRFSFINTLMNEVPGIGVVEKSFPEVGTIRVKANEKIQLFK